MEVVHEQNLYDNAVIIQGLNEQNVEGFHKPNLYCNAVIMQGLNCHIRLIINDVESLISICETI